MGNRCLCHHCPLFRFYGIISAFRLRLSEREIFIKTVLKCTCSEVKKQIRGLSQVYFSLRCRIFLLHSCGAPLPSERQW
ncbi:hypothetical protein TNCT_617181 [Trichonephila clavata]|uniref:Uncharacterized protein n=1 Tax=Trichonephila clavata TaxID=2740835 RepID=A0A8X6KCL0_TRICU|nr:hypothetical protein TNCT_617181 [Trichonephila clavata]